MTEGEADYLRRQAGSALSQLLEAGRDSELELLHAHAVRCLWKLATRKEEQPMNNGTDLTKCKPGDCLIQRDGCILRYEGRHSGAHFLYPHIAKTDDDLQKSYTDMGTYYLCGIEDRRDIVAVLPHTPDPVTQDALDGLTERLSDRVARAEATLDRHTQLLIELRDWVRRRVIFFFHASELEKLCERIDNELKIQEEKP